VTRNAGIVFVLLVFVATPPVFAQFLGRLQSMREGDGTLLDRSMIMYGCGIADSNRHTHEKLPILLMGGANGGVQTGRHIAMNEDTPVANLFLSMMDRMGVDQDKFGDSSGKLEIA